MRSTGIVAEYNPFHYGHQFHIAEARRKSEADVIIVIMSGNFLQRGEPALVSKWSRTHMALQAGADIVIELPYSFAVQKAETFAFGSMALLNALHCQSVCFGSELGQLEPFQQMVHAINENKEIHEANIRKHVRKGMSYPQAVAAAHKQISNQPSKLDLSKPNNILGFHYMNEAQKINQMIKFFTIQRKIAHYHDESFNDDRIASATSIRKALHEHDDLAPIQQYVPHFTYEELITYKKRFGQFHHWEQYWPYLQYRLLTMDSIELEKIYDINEGLHNRLQRIAQSANSFHTFMQAIKTKRYTWTRLQRICVHILTNTTKESMKTKMEKPNYIRLLGMNRMGRTYINQIKKELPLPLVSKVSSLPAHLVILDQKSSQVYALGLQEPYRGKLMSMEYAQPPIMITD